MSIKSFSIIIVFLLSSAIGFGQEEKQEFVPTNINEQFDKILKDHATWEIYKVVPVKKMNAFKTALNDTIRKKENKIIALKKMVDDAEAKTQMEEEKVSNLQVTLDSSQLKNNEITFLGITFSKTPYQFMVWSLIVVLVILIVIFYLMFLRSNSISSQSRREVEQVKKELEDLRTKAHEKQIKLKRQLQTAENLLNEKGLK